MGSDRASRGGEEQARDAFAFFLGSFRLSFRSFDCISSVRVCFFSFYAPLDDTISLSSR